ncbi:MAG: cysteine hydrolase [Rhodothermales bacterium]|nr:cysteine hydrolase [Rhodothermales bacterium]
MGEQPDSSCLIVVDLLEDYFDRQLWPQSQIPDQRHALVENTNRMVSAFRSVNLPVIWIRQEFEPDLSDAFPHMIRKGMSYTIRDTPGSRLLTELEHKSTDPVFVKKRFSAFFETDLKSFLTSQSISSIYLAGITSSWCLRSTAVDAYQYGFHVTLIDECISGFVQTAHEFAMSEMDGYIASVAAMDDVIAQIGSTSNTENTSR